MGVDSGPGDTEKTICMKPKHEWKRLSTVRGRRGRRLRQSRIQVNLMEHSHAAGGPFVLSFRTFEWICPFRPQKLTCFRLYCVSPFTAPAFSLKTLICSGIRAIRGSRRSQDRCRASVLRKIRCCCSDPGRIRGQRSAGPRPREALRVSSDDEMLAMSMLARSIGTSRRTLSVLRRLVTCIQCRVVFPLSRWYHFSCMPSPWRLDAVLSAASRVARQASALARVIPVLSPTSPSRRRILTCAISRCSSSSSEL